MGMDFDRIKLEHMTWKEGIKIEDLREGDIVFIKKIIRGYDYHFFCKFIEYKRGIVKAEIMDSSRREWNSRDIGKIITARKTSCYLYGKDKDDRWGCCKWFGD